MALDDIDVCSSPPKDRDWLTILMHVAAAIGLILTVVCLIWAWRGGYLHDIDKLRALMRRIGPLAPVVFVLFQFIQVVIPIVPGGITSSAGVLMFGPWLGLLYNYLGISAGSMIAFLVGRHYGAPLVRRIIGKKTYDKYVVKLNTKGYKRFFALAILAPMAPDDALCYLTGLSKMRFRTFALIILLCKPPTIAAYSLFIIKLGEYILQFIG